MRYAHPILKGLATVLIFAAVFLLPVKVVPLVRQWLEDREAAGQKHTQQVQQEKLAELAQDEPDTLCVPEDVHQTLGITLARVQSAVAPEPLKLDGALYLLSNSMVHVHSRFAGDVMEVGRFVPLAAPVPGVETSPDRPREIRPLQFGDFVRKGQLLAVVWSKDLGEKKSELVEGAARLRIDKERLKNLEELELKGSIAHDKVREQKRLVESGIVAVEKAERTLLSWQVSETEIEAIRAEAEKIHEGIARRDTRLHENWARVEVRAFVDGTIVEKNVAVGDFISNDLDLFKIADLSRMDVVAHAYEEDVPIIERLPPNHRDWTIYLKADPEEEPLKGSFDRVLPIIDPTQHTALVRGWVDNSRGRLRVGQFITAWIELPIPDDEVSVPVSALIDQDGETYVFVRSASDPLRFKRRKVFVVRRRDDIVSLSCHHVSRKTRAAVDAAPLAVGEWVVTTGGLQLAAELSYLQSQAPTEAKGAKEPVGKIDAAQK